MNKRWTEQKYVIYFLLSVMALGVCGGVCYGASCCQNGGFRNEGAELAWTAGEADERYVAYTASEQRVIEVDMLAYDGEQGQNNPDAQPGRTSLQMGEVPDGHVGTDAAAGADGNMTADAAAGADGSMTADMEADADREAGATRNAAGHAGAGEGTDVGGGTDAAADGKTAAEQTGSPNAGAGAAEQTGSPNAGAGAAEQTGSPNAETEAAGQPGSPNTDTGSAGQTGEDAETAPETEDGADVQTGGYVIAVSDADYEALLRIVQAEAGNEDTKGKILVANVVLNRVADERFPNSVYEVVFQRAGGKAQFSPIASGSYYKVVVSDDTREAVERALAGEDYSEGALFFAARRYAGSSQMRWFDECLTKLFSYGGHEFFTS